ncbi:MAG: hypothetical protein AAGK93_08920, partial [Pseudomonadota bacterium]
QHRLNRSTAQSGPGNPAHRWRREPDPVEILVRLLVQVQAVLNGNGTCKVFHGTPPYGAETAEYQLGYRCDGGKVSGPTG